MYGMSIPKNADSALLRYTPQQGAAKKVKTPLIEVEFIVLSTDL